MQSGCLSTQTFPHVLMKQIDTCFVPGNTELREGGVAKVPGSTPSPAWTLLLPSADLYSGWMAAALGSNLQVQFWRRKTMPPNCSGQYHVSDVTTIEFPGGPSYRTTRDHSKWAVASTSAKTWVCVSDLNRNYGGYLRSGGALCTQIPKLFNSFKSLVKTVQPCPHTTVHPIILRRI